MTTREKELFNYIGQDINYYPLIKNVVELEEELEALRKLPKLKTHPKDLTKQKALPAAKQYKEFLQQYINGLKVLQRAAGVEDHEEESPLRRWINGHLEE